METLVSNILFAENYLAPTTNKQCDINATDMYN